MESIYLLHHNIALFNEHYISQPWLPRQALVDNMHSLLKLS